MRCSQAQRLLSMRRDIALSARQTHALAAHLANCVACRKYEGAWTEVSAELAAAGSTRAEGTLARNAISLWRTEVGGRQRGGRNIAVFGSALAIGSAALIVVGLARRPHAAQVRKIASIVGTQPQDVMQNMAVPGSIAVAVPSVAVAADHHRAQPIHTPRAPAGYHAETRRAASVQTDDLAYVNTDAAAVVSRWNRLDVDQAQAQLTQLQQSVRGGDDFVRVPVPSIAGTGHSAVQAALDAYRQQVAIVDARLQHRVTLAVRGVPLADLCQQLSAETGITLHAGRTVADDKITVFCTKRTLRDLMRQITRMFGFSWLREGEEGSFRYELAQDLRSQLLEEELRNQDRDAALVALDREMERYRKYLPLSPLEARRQSLKAAEEDVKLLNTLGGAGWAPVHLYFTLSPQEETALREGPELRYSEMNAVDERPLPPELRDNILGALTDVRINTEGGGFGLTTDANAPGMTPAEFPGSRANLTLQLDHGQLDRYTLRGEVGVMAVSPTGSGGTNLDATLAVGISPALANLNNAAANARFANSPTMRRHVTVITKASCFPGADYNHWEPAPRATIADALEALHKSTGQDIVGDDYTRLYNAGDLSTTDKTLFDTLNRLADKMRLRWKPDGEWLAFRSATYYYDRPKEVPQRLLTRWAASKRKNGMLTVGDLVEIAQLNNSQLDSNDVAEGAWAIYGLSEWPWVQASLCRDHWRLLAELSPELLEAVTAPGGISFADLPAAQAQRCIALLLPLASGASGPQRSLQEFEGGTLRLKLPKPEKLREVPKGQSYSPMNYGPVFHYEYGGTTGRRKIRDLGPYGMTSSG